jgi:hypothetical protein
MNKSKANELLDIAIARLGSLKAVCDATSINKSTLLHIKAGDTARPHVATIGKLHQAAYGE